MFSLVVYSLEKHPESYYFVIGTNSECSAIHNSLCSERAALSQLRFYSEPLNIIKVILISDSITFLSPGVLCRESMLENYCNSETRLVMSGTDRNSKIVNLGDLYPHNNLYHNIDVDKINYFSK